MSILTATILVFLVCSLCCVCYMEGRKDGISEERGFPAERGIKRLLESGNAAQIEKLLKYRDKPNVIDTAGKNFEELYELTDKELKELKLEIFGVIPSERDPVLIRHEAADVANYAHIIILKCDEVINETV